VNKPCDQCPWRLTNQGKRHRRGFYSASNLRRLWNLIRRGGGGQSCHLTDPRHPYHIEAGCPEGAKPKECPGSVILVLREIGRMADARNRVTDAGVKRRPLGLTKLGILYWVVQRLTFGHVPFLGDGGLPAVDQADPEIGLPAFLDSAGVTHAAD
jgi:hypothetical protein